MQTQCPECLKTECDTLDILHKKSISFKSWPPDEELKKDYSYDFYRLPKEEYLKKRFPSYGSSQEFRKKYLWEFEKRFYCLTIRSEIKGDPTPTKIVKYNKKDSGEYESADFDDITLKLEEKADLIKRLYNGLIVQPKFLMNPWIQNKGITWSPKPVLVHRIGDYDLSGYSIFDFEKSSFMTLSFKEERFHFATYKYRLEESGFL